MQSLQFIVGHRCVYYVLAWVRRTVPLRLLLRLWWVRLFHILFSVLVRQDSGRRGWVGSRLDVLGPQVYLESCLKEQTHVIQQEPEREISKLMLGMGSVVDVVSSQVLLCLLEQLGSFFLVIDKLLLLSIDLGLEVAQPPVQVVLSEGMRDLIIVLEGIFQIFLGWCVLRFIHLNVAESSFTTSGSEPTAQLCKLGVSQLEELLGLMVIVEIVGNTGPKPQKISHNQVLAFLESHHQSVVKVGVQLRRFGLFQHKQHSQIVDYNLVQRLFLLHIALTLNCLFLSTCLYHCQNVFCVDFVVSELVTLLLIQAFEFDFEQVLIELPERIFVLQEAQLSEKDGLEVVFLNQEQFLGPLASGSTGTCKPVNLGYSLFDLSANSVMISVFVFL